MDFACSRRLPLSHPTVSFFTSPTPRDRGPSLTSPNLPSVPCRPFCVAASPVIVRPPDLCADSVEVGQELDPSASLPVTLVEPDMRFARIRRSDQASTLHPRKVASRFRQPDKTQLTLLVTGPPGPASSEYVPEDLPKRRTMLLNKADGKNRESENPEEISLLNGRNPTVALAIPGGALRNREFAARGEAAPSVCEHGRNDKTPKRLPHGVLR